MRGYAVCHARASSASRRKINERRESVIRQKFGNPLTLQNAVTTVIANKITFKGGMLVGDDAVFRKQVDFAERMTLDLTPDQDVKKVFPDLTIDDTYRIQFALMQ